MLLFVTTFDLVRESEPFGYAVGVGVNTVMKFQFPIQYCEKGLMYSGIYFSL